MGLQTTPTWGPVCNDAGGNALAWTFGLGNFTNGYGVDEITGEEDLGSTTFHLFLGANQAETHPVTFAHLLREREKRGARLVVVDPRLTPTGAQADSWLAPKPHTDLALALGMLGHIVGEALHDREFVDRWVLGFDELKAHLMSNGYTPEWAAEVTGVSANRIREIAEGYARAERATIFGNAGISHQMNAFQTYRTLAFLAALTGNIGKPGTGCNFMHNTWPGELHLPPTLHPTPARDVALPMGPDWFAESILEARPYRLRALVTEGNPIIGSANTRRVREALKEHVIAQSPNGSVRGTALLWSEMRRDTIFAPNSFGDAQVVGDEVGAPRYEPANVLVDDRYFDNLSGQQAYKCFACRVRKA